MRLIFIHGMNQQEYQAQSLKQHWVNILQQGLAHSHSAYHSDDFDIEMAFYGDLISSYQKPHPINDTTQKHIPLFEPIHKAWQNINILNTHTSSTLTADIPLLPLYQPSSSTSLAHQLWWHSARMKGALYKNMMIKLNQHPQLHLKVLQRFLNESYLYLTNLDFRQAIYQRLVQQFTQDDRPAIVVAHSLGTVIAYNFLREYPQFTVQRLITLASPLPYQAMRHSFKQPIARPTNLLGDWYNFCADEDFFATHPLNVAPFHFQPQIIQRTIHTFVDKPHEIIGYLQHPQVISAITQSTACPR